MVQLGLLPAAAQRGQQPGSAPSQTEKVQRDTQLIRWDGLLVPCPTDVVDAPLGARTLRQFWRQLWTWSQETALKSLLSDLELTCKSQLPHLKTVSTISATQWNKYMSNVHDFCSHLHKSGCVFNAAHSGWGYSAAPSGKGG